MKLETFCFTVVPIRCGWMCKSLLHLIYNMWTGALLVFILIIVQRDATQSSLLIILQVHSTCFACQTHPSSGVHKTVTTASGTGHIFCAATSLQRGQNTGYIFLCSQAQRGQASLGTLERGSCTKNITSTGGCSYSFVYSWWWVWFKPETCRVNMQNNK